MGVAERGTEKTGDGADGCSIWSLQACWPVSAKVENLAIHCGDKNLDKDSVEPPSEQVIESSISVELYAADAQVSPKGDDRVVLSSQLRQFTFDDLKSATRNFRSDSFLGEGGFGCVFKGWIDERGTAPVKPGTGLTVAVKVLNQSGSQGHKEWLTEINILGQFHHPHLVRLVGFCIEEDRRLLVYEFMERGSLENHLFRRRASPITWNVRMKIALGAARGLAFLHSGSNGNRPVIYRDFKSSNILLNMDFTAKLSDFGLAKDGPEGDKTHVSTRVVGTYGYAAPEYIMTGHLTNKSDVYSFGVVLLEMLTGKRAVDKNRPDGEHSLAEWARPYLEDRSKIFKIVDARLDGQFSVKGSQRAGNLAYQCLSRDPRKRPSMVEVVEVLDRIQNLQDTANVTHASSYKEGKQSMPPITGKAHKHRSWTQKNATPT